MRSASSATAMTMLESARRNAPFIAILFAITLTGLALSLALLALLMRM